MHSSRINCWTWVCVKKNRSCGTVSSKLENESVLHKKVGYFWISAVAKCKITLTFHFHIFDTILCWLFWVEAFFPKKLSRNSILQRLDICLTGDASLEKLNFLTPILKIDGNLYCNALLVIPQTFFDETTFMGAISEMSPVFLVSFPKQCWQKSLQFRMKLTYSVKIDVSNLIYMSSGTGSRMIDMYTASNS